MPARMLAGIVAALALASPAAAADLRVFPVAGDHAGYSGDGGAAWDARLRPTSVAPAADGSLLVLDAANERVRRIAPDGRITAVAGTGKRGFSGDGGPATTARLSLFDEFSYVSTGLLALPDGGFVIADPGNDRVRRVGPDGTIATVAGSGARGYAGDAGPAAAAALDHPADLAALAGGGTAIAAGTLRATGADATIGTLLGRARCTPGDGNDLVDPSDADTAPDGSLLIADDGCVWRLGADGRLTPLAGNPYVGVRPADDYGGPALGVLADRGMRVAALPGGGALMTLAATTDDASHRPTAVVWRVGPDGGLTRVAGCTKGCAPLTDGGDARTMTLGSVASLDAEADGTAVLVAGTSLVRVSADGIAHVTRVPAGIQSIALSPDGALYGIQACLGGDGGCTTPPTSSTIARIVAIAGDGTLTVVATHDGSAGADLYPVDLTVASDGTLWVASGPTHLQRVTGGELRTVRDVPVAKDGWSQSAIAAMPTGDLALVHSGPSAAYPIPGGDVQRLAPDGAVTTVAGPAPAESYVRSDWRVAATADGGVVAVSAPSSLQIVRLAPGAGPRILNRKRPVDAESGEDQIPPAVAGWPGRDLLVAIDGRLYRLDGTRLRRLDGDGTGGYFGSTDGALLRDVRLGPADDLVPATGGATYVAGNGRVRLLSAARSPIAAIAITRESLPLTRGRALVVRTTRPGIVEATALDARGRVAGRGRNEVGAGRAVITFARRLPAGAYRVRAILRTAGGARAGDGQPLLLGGALPVSAARRMADDDARCGDRTRARAADDEEMSDLGTGACRRLGRARVDCRVYRADGSTWSGWTSRTCSVLAVRLDRDGVVRVRRYGDRAAKDPAKPCRPSQYTPFAAAPRWSTLRWAEAAPLRLG